MGLEHAIPVLRGDFVKPSDSQNPSVGMDFNTTSHIGIVVIGRNEGDRLRRCLESVISDKFTVVYVDSGSTDNSTHMAAGKGVAVVNLDMQIPFTAARARNAGVDKLREVAPGVRYIQFVDGDCELTPGWLDRACGFLEAHSDVAVVAGQLREKFPDASVYNMLCNMEWSAVAGEAAACGGIAMMRADAFDSEQGFNGSLICGEEPELCARLRARGWRVWRLAEEMGWHDANMTRFGQWWMRTVRGGYSFAQAAVMSRSGTERRGVRESNRAWIFGLIIPTLILALAIGYKTEALWLFIIYPLQVVRLASKGRFALRQNCWQAFFLVIGKFPEVQGQIKFYYERLVGRRSMLIEHK